MQGRVLVLYTQKAGRESSLYVSHASMPHAPPLLLLPRPSHQSCPSRLRPPYLLSHRTPAPTVPIKPARPRPPPPHHLIPRIHVGPILDQHLAHLLRADFGSFVQGRPLFLQTGQARTHARSTPHVSHTSMPRSPSLPEVHLLALRHRLPHIPSIPLPPLSLPPTDPPPPSSPYPCADAPFHNTLTLPYPLPHPHHLIPRVHVGPILDQHLACLVCLLGAAVGSAVQRRGLVLQTGKMEGRRIGGTLLVSNTSMLHHTPLPSLSRPPPPPSLPQTLP